MIDLKDFRGNQINIGDDVAYPVRKSSALWMCSGEVVDIYTSGVDWRGNPIYRVVVRKYPSNRIVTIYCTERLVKL